ncbi:SWIM zinc finger family protein [Pengzhenrongella frigida]|uniref:SWIM zinc finger family protein n=1 Tax=Pengzhenrongella frigida TaxID=1259133 RepID=A0A4Q5N4P2_9MICO|nr:SWIM zinc finger family protein [Cellulomonas sp. HLT2-17]RYV52313.1 SWIM zinc finger family protein [Cellulomonas sp. HLT2-17]
MADTVVQHYRYVARSRGELVDGQPTVRLETALTGTGDPAPAATASGAPAHDEYGADPFFTGSAERADVVAAGLLRVAEVARTRYYLPPGLARRLAFADPIITAESGHLRFESLSACCGVYARLDVLPGGLDTTRARHGTTNIDVNGELRALLGQVVRTDPMQLQVGRDDVAVRTLDGSAVERRVDLPVRWISSLGAQQAAASRMTLRHELDAGAARRFVRGLPRSSASTRAVWASAVAGGGLRLASRPAAGSVCLGGPERLRVLEPLLRLATGLRVYGEAVDPRSEPVASCWELLLPHARFVLGLSPQASRGFSGEGALLDDLAQAHAGTDTDSDAVRAANGQLGYDPAEQRFFPRLLPFDLRAVPRANPRLEAARTLAADGAVHAVGEDVLVRSAGVDYAVRLGVDDTDRCTCAWYGKHRGARGPCKHVLAVRLSSPSGPTGGNPT